ncbi:PREDICTED: alpha-tocopherol transfer protein-like [Cyphomyrmex costatus]|uniref:Alpha-tocopherol transfer protein-like protein n=1 Tax=Cyphomyrmex costatus TaxID=456900 RepID=A0A151ILR8_9HYME|nr:PREDICTED: alpha-tocopherol transfer protein-like [Cyphomyrmex costatus]XP_018407763.1 PREDICTED: alpha-tocopherol transfer protein-like [Cyphomyrmex costatus]KYN05827.1 Alpha-tocopherol transfer protein-like protein [Cyphomyrmex costatus]
MTNERNHNDNIVDYVSQELTNEDKKYAAEYLNETDETRENAVSEIKLWIENELRIQIDDFLILRFLRVGKFNLEKTKIRIRNYYKQRSNLPEWFTNKNPFQPKVQEYLNLGMFLPLLKPDNQGRLILLIRGTLNDPRIHNIADMSKACMLTIELAVKFYPAASVYGIVSLIDMIDPTIRHILQFGPHTIMNIIHTWQSCYPMRYQAFNVFNVPKFFNVIINLAKSFMTKKLKDRFHVYADNLECFKDIPANILPVEYGGTAGTCQELTEYWKKAIEENSDWLTKDDNVQIE